MNQFTFAQKQVESDQQDENEEINYQSLTSSIYNRSINIGNSLTSALKSTMKTIGQLKTNVVYSVVNSSLPIPSIQRKQIQIRNDGSQASLLGIKYNFSTDYKFKYVFRNTFWFSYRKDIGQSSVQSDNGWGCMIRAVQMLFAQIIKRHYQYKQTESDHLNVIKLFNQNMYGVFSLKSICEQGNIENRWTSALQILGIFKLLLDKHMNKFSLILEVFTTGIFYDNFQNHKFKSYPAVLTISNRIGVKEIAPELHSHYFKLMDSKYFVGNIGGVKGQALFIIGYYDQRVIYLDPHYVQSNQNMNIDTFFQSTPRGIKIEELSPSVTFCYYFKSQKQHRQWLEWISSLTEEYYPSIVFEVISNARKQSLLQKVSDIDDSFQDL